MKKGTPVIDFEQSNWMEPYIMLNSRLKTAANNEFEKDFFKLMNNSLLERRWKMSEITKIRSK